MYEVSAFGIIGKSFPYRTGGEAKPATDLTSEERAQLRRDINYRRTARRQASPATKRVRGGKTRPVDPAPARNAAGNWSTDRQSGVKYDFRYNQPGYHTTASVPQESNQGRTFRPGKDRAFYQRSHGERERKWKNRQENAVTETANQQAKVERRKDWKKKFGEKPVKMQPSEKVRTGAGLGIAGGSIAELLRRNRARAQGEDPKTFGIPDPVLGATAGAGLFDASNIFGGVKAKQAAQDIRRGYKPKHKEIFSAYKRKKNVKSIDKIPANERAGFFSGYPKKLPDARIQRAVAAADNPKFVAAELAGGALLGAGAAYGAKKKFSDV